MPYPPPDPESIPIPIDCYSVVPAIRPATLPIDQQLDM